MIERVLVLSALACAGVSAFGYLPEFVTSCEDYADEASCPISYGSGCFWGWDTTFTYMQCTSTDPCTLNVDESSCIPVNMYMLPGMESCAWNGASCQTDECSYYGDSASCPAWSYGSQCFWTLGHLSGMGICTSLDPCSINDGDDEWSCIGVMTEGSDQCTWNGASCETSECSYVYDEATCTGSGCYWALGMNGYEVCRSWEGDDGLLMDDDVIDDVTAP